MVLHEEHGELEVVADLADELAEIGDLLVVQPAGRLVEQEEARLRHQGARELDALLDPVRQCRCREERAVAEADDVEDLEGFLLTGAPPSAVCSDRTFSSTDIVRKSWMFWNVLATPLRTILNAGCLRSDDPSSRTSPVSGLYRRVMTLNAVVLPAPFGPMRPEM